MENHEKFKNIKDKFKDHFSEKPENKYAKKKKKIKRIKVKLLKKVSKSRYLKFKKKNLLYLELRKNQK